MRYDFLVLPYFLRKVYTHNGIVFTGKLRLPLKDTGGYAYKVS